MSRFMFLFAIAIQISFIYGDKITAPNDFTTDNEVKKEDTSPMDWFDLFFPPDLSITTPIITKVKKPTKKQLEEIKEMANLITLIINDEMKKLIADTADKEGDKSRSKRSANKSSIDNSHIILKLLNHIKTSNEHQNRAIEKIMEAKEIADHYGIDFVPDSEIFSELAIASSRQTEDLSLILNDVFTVKNSTAEHIIEFVPIDEDTVTNRTENNDYYAYSTNESREEINERLSTPSEVLSTEAAVVQIPDHEIILDIEIPIESQIVTPPIQHQISFSYMPDFFQQILVAPIDISQCAPAEESFTSSPVEVPDPEPELVGEEFEETLSSKVIVDKGEDVGSATVNHVTTYTISEISHFRKPELELPQKMQYYFLLI